MSKEVKDDKKSEVKEEVKKVIEVQEEDVVKSVKPQCKRSPDPEILITSKPDINLNNTFDYEDLQLIYRALGQVTISLDTPTGEKVMQLRAKLVDVFTKVEEAKSN